jgi:hypothetical protein
MPPPFESVTGLNLNGCRLPMASTPLKTLDGKIAQLGYGRNLWERSRVGEGIRSRGANRNDIFIATKLWERRARFRPHAEATQSEQGQIVHG